jgi:hypothetical protein
LRLKGITKTKLPFLYIQVMSISRSQAALLADGLLDNLGSADAGDLQPRETLTELLLLAGELAEMATDNLHNDNTNSSGKLAGSIVVSDPRDEGNVVSADVLMEEYGKYVNSGVKGTKSGAGLYSFKYPNPSRKQVARMLLGIRSARKASKNVNASRSISKHEVKSAKLADFDHAWAAARSVKLYGIKATGFMDRAIKKTEEKVEERLGAAFKIDIINSLPDGDNNTSIPGSV